MRDVNHRHLDSSSAGAHCSTTLETKLMNLSSEAEAEDLLFQVL